MQIPKTILVALDLTEMDKTLITYASFLAKSLGIEQVYFVHNIKKYELSQLFDEQLKNINLDEIIGNELNEKVSKFFTASVPWEVLISEDPYTETLINYIVGKYNVELVLLGNKNGQKGSGTVSWKLLRLLKCDLLAVPENPDYKWDTIWTGTDFSRESKKALGKAIGIAAVTGASMTVAHVYTVPMQFSHYVPKETMTPKIREYVTEKCRKFIQKLECPVPVAQNIIAGRDTGIAEQLIEEAQKAKADLLVIGDKGINNFSTLLIGSVTETIFNRITSPALWIAKR